jgi:hypothetical protein
MREARLIIVMDDFEFWIKNVAFEVKMFNKYGIFDQITNRNMKNLRYAYLHCDLLDKVALTTIALKLKLVHIKTHEQHLQKNMFIKVKLFSIASKFKGVLKKVTCMLSLQLNQ